MIKSGTYSYNKKWRKENKSAWNEQKRRHNNRSLVKATANRKHYTQEELAIVLDKSKSVSQVALLLNRSYYAIQQTRIRYKKLII